MNAGYLIKTAGGVETGALTGNGDFRSDECIKILREADVVVTNPPFSLFREYVAQLMDYRKSFVIIGNINSITYKEIFPLIKNGGMWLGWSIHNGCSVFNLRSGESQSFSNVRWFTNIPPRNFEPLNLTFEYSPELYPKYDNYDAIEVSRTAKIPRDYFGVMGVPITFLDKYNPQQFEILGMAAGNSRACGFNYDVKYVQHEKDRGGCGVVNDERVFARLLIRRRQ